MSLAPGSQLALNLTAWWSAVKFHIIEVQFYGNADISPEWVRRVRMVTRLFKIWTERSGQSPLKLTIEILGRNEIDERLAEKVERNLDELVDAVRATSARWQVVDLTLHFSNCTHALVRLFDLPAEQVPILQCLDATAICDDLPLDSTLVRALQHIPSTSGVFTTSALRTLRLRGAWGRSSPIDIPKSWGALTDLSLSAWSADRHQVLDPILLLHYLKQIPLLQSLSFNLFPPFNDGHPVQLQPIPIHLPYLTSLHILVEVHPTPRGFAQHISLPALRTLCVQLRCMDDNYLISRSDELVELIRQVGHTLRTLSLPLNLFDQIAVVSVLSCLPHLEELTSNTDILTHGRVDTSTVGPDCRTLVELNEGRECMRCPRLNRLFMAVQGKYVDNSIEDAVLKFLLRRCGEPALRRCSRIQLLRVQFAHKRSKSSLDVLQELQRNGVDLEDTVVQIEYSKY